MSFSIRASARALVAPVFFCLASAWGSLAFAQELSIADVSIAEGDSGTKSMVFTVKLSAASANVVRFDAATADGTALAGSDYTATASAALRIPAGNTTKTFAVPIVGDATPEPNETFTVNLINPVGATLSDNQAIGTITNDDIPAATLSINDVSAKEGDLGKSWAVFTVSLSQPSASDVIFTVTTAAGTASGADSDYVAFSEPRVISAGQSQVSVSVPLIGDTQVEPDETFSLNLSNPEGAVVADGQGIGTILDDDANPVPPGAPTNVVAAAAVLGADVSFDRPASTGTGVITGYTVTSFPAGAVDDWPGSVNTTHHLSGLVKGTYYTFSVTANATAGTGPASQASNSVRPLTLPGPVTLSQLQPGNSMVTVSFNPPADPGDFEIIGYYVRTNEGEGYDNSQGSLSTTHEIRGLTGGTPYTFTIYAWTAAGAGEALVTTESATPTGLAGPPVMGSATGSGSSATVTFSAPATDGGSPITGYVVRGSSNFCESIIDTDSGSLSLTHVIKNLRGNTACTFTAHALNSAGEGPGSEPSNAVTYDQPDLLISFPQVQEGNSGTSVATFTFSLSRATDHPVSFDVATSDGTATAGSDYVARSSVHFVIPAGETSVNFDVTVNGDTEGEAEETFQSNVANVDGAFRIPPMFGQATIKNDDPLPQLAIYDASMLEGSSGSFSLLTFNVGLDFPATCDVHFTATPGGGTATASQDYWFAFVYGVIPKGSSLGLVSVQVYGDLVDEGDETFEVSLSNVTCATVADGTATGTITDDDAPSGPTLSIGDVSIAEGNSGTQLATFTVTLSAAQSGPVNFDLATANGTATAGSDYVAKASSGLSIAAGTNSKTFTVIINGDTTQEPNEAFFVNLINPIGATIADGQAVGTITNDDAAATPTLSIADASVSEGNSGTKTLTFTVSLSPAAVGTVSYNIATSNGTATSGSDYVASSLTGQTINAGATSKTFAVSINGDTTTEANETFNVALSGLSGATLGDGSAVGTITNDDGSGGTPTLSIADVSMAEGNSLSKQMTFTVKLSAAASGPVTYRIATANGTALAPGDYTAKSLAGQSMAAGATSKTFTVAIKGDTVAEANETFKVNVSGVSGATLGDGQAIGTITNDDAARVGIARFDAGDLVDDVDDGHREPLVTTKEYASLLADGARSMCRRTPNAAIIAIDGVENRQVLADLAAAANALCAGRPAYNAVMADTDSRGFLIAAPAKDEPSITALGKPETSAVSTALTLLVPGHAQPVTVVLASGPNKELARQLRLRAKAQPTESLVLLGAKAMTGLVDLTARAQAKPGVPLPDERILVNPALIERYRQPRIELTPQSSKEPPAQMLELQ